MAKQVSDKNRQQPQQAQAQNMGQASGPASVSQSSASSSQFKADRERKSGQKQQSGSMKSSDSGGLSEAAGAAGKIGLGVKVMGFAKHMAAMAAKAAAAVKAMTILQAVVYTAMAIVMTVVMTVLSILFGNDAEELAQKDSYSEDCVVYISKGAIGNGSEPVDDDLVRMRTARQIYHVLFTYGLRPEQCFAVLGNWAVESGIDPTAVETVYNESYRIGPQKQDALRVDFLLAKWKPNYTVGGNLMTDNILRVGIGLGQWTDLPSNNNFNKGRNTKLREYAQFAGHETYKGDEEDAFQWYDLAVQLAYALDTSPIGDSGAAWMKSFSEIGKEEFEGDKGSHNKYANPIYPIVGENDEHEEDDYYDDEDRETARIEADTQADAAEANGDFNRWVQDGVDPVTGPYGHYEVDQNMYNEFWKDVYKKTLYWETTKRYTEKFLAEWEGVPGMMLDERIEKAKVYFDMWWDSSVLGEPNFDADEADLGSAGKFFKIEEGYANSVLKVLDVTKNVNLKVTKAYHTDGDINTCRTYTFSTAKNIAQCAAMLAWPTRAESVGNNGTALFQHVHDLVLPGDGVYMSCDRTVATAVRWSGFDDEYPAGPTLTQMQYLVTSPRWTELDWGGDPAQLMAGDVLIKKDSMAAGANEEDEDANDTHHTLIYVGEWIAHIYGSEDGTYNDVTDGGCIVEGSFGERSPGIGTWSDSFSEYHAFRCTNPMDPQKSKYMGIGGVDGME